MSFLHHRRPLDGTGSAPLVISFWQQAGNNVYHVLDVNEFGWKVVDGCLEIEWVDPSNFEQVKESVHPLLRGCCCKKGCNNREVLVFQS